MAQTYNDLLKHPLVNVSKELTLPEPVHPVHDELCQREIKTPKQLSKLRCRYRRTQIAIYWSKEEILHYDPWIALYHDVISDQEINIVLNNSITQMARSDLTGSTNATNEDVMATQVFYTLHFK